MRAGTVRVTFDKAVRAVFPGEDLFDLGAPSYLAVPPDRLILELKYTGYLPEQVRRLFRVPGSAPGVRVEILPLRRPDPGPVPTGLRQQEGALWKTM